MKLFVVSHACVLPINQGFFAAVEALTGWSLSLVVPSVWKNEYTAHIAPQRNPALKGVIHSLPVWRAGSVPAHIYKSAFVSLLRREKPDAIYVHHEPYGLATSQVYLANALGRNVPIGFYTAQNIFKPRPLPLSILERFVLARSTFSFPVTEGARTVLQEKGYRGVAEVLPLPVDLEVYERKPAEALQIREKLGIAPGEFVIGYLGRLVPEKGLLTLMRALAVIAEQRWTCVIAGAGELEPELRAEIHRLQLTGRVLLVGYVPHPDAPQWMSAFDVLVLASETTSSWKEQFGRVLLEANACGTAVVGSECGEIPNVIQSTQGGLVVPEKDPERLAAALLELLQQPTRRLQLAEQGRLAVLRDYEQSHLAARFSQVIEQAVQRPTGKR